MRFPIVFALAGLAAAIPLPRGAGNKHSTFIHPELTVSALDNPAHGIVQEREIDLRKAPNDNSMAIIRPIPRSEQDKFEARKAPQDNSMAIIRPIPRTDLTPGGKSQSTY